MKTRIEFTLSPIRPPALCLASREIGALAEFSGIVREIEKDRKIKGLFYEAHVPMAAKILARISEELSQNCPCDELLLIHRLDFVPVGETSLYIRVQARQRAPAFCLLTALIDRLKTDVPVWKRA